jgi:ketosteroid isomerase-like protein
VSTEDDVERISMINAAVGARDVSAVSEHMHPDVVWEHNLGIGSPEEGVYRGRETVVALMERILDPWEYLRLEQRELHDLGGGRYLVRGDMHAKHVTSDVELVAPYEQRLEIREGLLAKGEMTTGEIA